MTVNASSDIQPLVYRGPLIDPLPLRSGSTDELKVDARERAQAPLDEAADRIGQLVDETGVEGFAAAATDLDERTLILYWKGPLPQAVAALVDDVRSGLRVQVRMAAYSKVELLSEAKRIAGLDRAQTGVRVSSVGPLRDYSGLRVEVDEADVARAELVIDSPVRLEFTVGSEAHILRSDRCDVCSSRMSDHLVKPISSGPRG